MIELSEEERAELERRAGTVTMPFRVVQRARVILYAAEGLQDIDIAARLDCSPDSVARRGLTLRLEQKSHFVPRGETLKRYLDSTGASCGASSRFSALASQMLTVSKTVSGDIPPTRVRIPPPPFSPT